MASTKVRNEPRLDGTRQLLDELDALMDQMLALPISDQDDDVALPPAPTVSATVTMLGTQESPAPVETEADIAAGPMRFDTPAEAPSAEKELEPEAEPTPAPASEPAIATMSDVAAPAPVTLMPLPPVAHPSRWRPDLISYQFLLWVNQGYDNGTTWFGKPGRLLRSRQGKMALAVVGLALFGGALAWLAKDWLGWIW